MNIQPQNMVEFLLVIGGDIFQSCVPCLLLFHSSLSLLLMPMIYSHKATIVK